MSDGDSLEVLNPMSGGDNLAVELVTRSDGTVVVVPVSKIRIGDAGDDRGSVSRALPLPTRDDALLSELQAMRAELQTFQMLVLERLK